VNIQTGCDVRHHRPVGTRTTLASIGPSDGETRVSFCS
jgi:hypothetical protein